MQPSLTAKFILTASVVMVLSCSTPNRMVKYTPREADHFTNSNLKTLLKNGNNVNIVLRVPNSLESVTTKNTMNQQILTSAAEREKTFDLYYNAIEKELLRAGFSVRDRGLFNEVLLKMQRGQNQNIDYSQIKDLTDTDIILEVIKIDPAVEYVTNKTFVQNKRGDWKEEITTGQYKKFGASAEYKIIVVKNNELAGTYKFHYAPCTEGCPLTAFQSKIKLPSMKGKTQVQPPAYEGVEVDRMEEFIKKSTQDLVVAMRR